MTFGMKLQALRKEKEISQLQLAEELGVSRQTLSKWENDLVIPDAGNIVAVACYFQVSADYLLGLSELRVYSELENNEEEKKVEDTWFAQKLYEKVILFFENRKNCGAVLLIVMAMYFIILLVVAIFQGETNNYYPIKLD